MSGQQHQVKKKRSVAMKKSKEAQGHSSKTISVDKEKQQSCEIIVENQTLLQAKRCSAPK